MAAASPARGAAMADAPAETGGDGGVARREQRTGGESGGKGSPEPTGGRRGGKVGGESGGMGDPHGGGLRGEGERGGVRMTIAEVERMYGTPSVMLKEVKGDGTTVIQVKVDGALMGLFTGRDPAALSDIGDATSCVVKAPSHFNKRTHDHAVIEVSGPSEQAATAAVDLFAHVLAQAIDSPSVGYSHFLSLPLAAHRPLVARLIDFRSSVLQSVGSLLTQPAASAGSAAAAGCSGSDAAANAAAGASGAYVAPAGSDAGAAGGYKRTEAETEGEGERGGGVVMDGCEATAGRGEVKVEGGEEGNRVESGGEEARKTMRGEKRVHSDGGPAAGKDSGTDAAGATLGATAGATLGATAGATLGATAGATLDATTGAGSAASTGGVSMLEGEGEGGGEGEWAAAAGRGGGRGKEEQWGQQGGSKGKGIKDQYGGVHPSIFINPSTFHLTVQMLKLWSPERVEKASQALQAAMPRVVEVLGEEPLVIRLVGLKCMRGHPSKAHVLYADMEEVDGGNRLPAVCGEEAGLVTPRDCRQPLKLHATIMNTSHRKGPHRYARMPFDASPIVAQHGDTEWGEVHLGEVHLSQRFSFDDQGYYHCCSSLPLP
ncbi:hypothetical protein CLOM_g1210 [Closterium sp. NIES-68]|nr:hypothetical protein CLOM_g1210 [Closterium sp. NIES-68]